MQPSENEWPPELKQAVENAQKETHREVDIEALRQEAYAKLPKNHVWRQRGPHAVCVSCKPEHSTWIGVDKNLSLNNEGEYVLTDRFLPSPVSGVEETGPGGHHLPEGPTA